jgi:hypothetical protein
MLSILLLGLGNTSFSYLHHTLCVLHGKHNLVKDLGGACVTCLCRVYTLHIWRSHSNIVNRLQTVQGSKTLNVSVGGAGTRGREH